VLLSMREDFSCCMAACQSGAWALDMATR
jgi:hypothetical protein